MTSSSTHSDVRGGLGALTEADPTGRVERLRRWLPRGRTLPAAEWEDRHRVMLWLLWVHVVGLALFLLCQGFGGWGSIAPVLPIAACGVFAGLRGADRRARSVAVVLGLLTASAVLVYGWHGQIEAHFHFFVMIAVLALYEDWLPFGLAIAYVVLEHGVLGVLAPHDVYSHGGNPWFWAAVHGGFVLAASAAAVTTWRLNENTRARMTQAHRTARETAERFRLAFESGISGMSMVDTRGRFIRVNRAQCEILGYSESELLDLTFSDITHPQERLRDVDRMQSLLSGEADVYTAEKRYLHRDGSVVWVQLGVRAMRDENGEVAFFLTQINDITARKRIEDELERWAMHDPLSGLPNRRLFVDRLERAVRRLARQPEPLAVLIVDLDRFKLVNDTLGHVAGDDVLVEAAARLQRAVRSEDTVARFGGDEFTVLCERADEEEARRVADRVRRAMGEPFRHDSRQFALGASIGIRVTRSAGAEAEELLHDADQALYAAKRGGRGRCELFDGLSRSEVGDQLGVEQALRQAIPAGELRLHYQPVVSLPGGHVVGLEALVRWERPGRGLVGPGEFIGAAEESGLILVLGEWVLREACAQLAAWRADGIVGDAVQMAVNVSARQLSDPGLIECLTTALRATGLPAGALCLEITENALVRDSDTARRNLDAITGLGVSVALDDFGVGFSSLSRIRDLPPVDAIKIDRSFVAGLDAHAADAAVITAVVSMAAHLGMEVVAEGIEEPSQRDEVTRLGCDRGQGYLFAAPQPPEVVARQLSGGRIDPPLAPVADGA